MTKSWRSTFRIALVAALFTVSHGFSLVMMGARRGKGNLKRGVSDSPRSGVGSINQGKGQEITGVTLPAPGKIKGWEFGEEKRMACANVDGQFYAVAGECPRCAFDLWKGDVVNDEAFEDLPRIACPTCSTTYSLRSGKVGPPLKRTGLAGFVSGLTKSATFEKSTLDVTAYQITRDEDGRVYCRERTKR